ncbi:MAG: GNAT family N-acetyltransferase [Woeseiaceae bacterium]|nr:GNAT family N-acetyltransferase [Woeseiaceae bacterium]
MKREIELSGPYRYATRDDALPMAQLINIAGEGMPLYLWTNLAAAGESPWDIGQQRAMRESGSFSYRNTVVREQRGEVAAALMGYPLPDEPEPADYDEMPPMFVPLQQLEDLVAGTWYLNVLATYAEHRGKGFGSGLLSIAEQLAADTNRSGLSIIVSDANTGARRLYERSGYVEKAMRPMVKESWENDGENWVLLERRL